MYALRAPQAAGARLQALRAWMDRRQESLIVTLSLLAGLYLVARSIYDLAT